VLEGALVNNPDRVAARARLGVLVGSLVGSLTASLAHAQMPVPPSLNFLVCAVLTAAVLAAGYKSDTSSGIKGLKAVGAALALSRLTRAHVLAAWPRPHGQPAPLAVPHDALGDTRFAEAVLEALLLSLQHLDDVNDISRLGVRCNLQRILHLPTYTLSADGQIITGWRPLQQPPPWQVSGGARKFPILRGAASIRRAYEDVIPPVDRLVDIQCFRVDPYARHGVDVYPLGDGLSDPMKLRVLVFTSNISGSLGSGPGVVWAEDCPHLEDAGGSMGGDSGSDSGGDDLGEEHAADGGGDIDSSGGLDAEGSTGDEASEHGSGLSLDSDDVLDDDSEDSSSGSSSSDISGDQAPAAAAAAPAAAPDATRAAVNRAGRVGRIGRAADVAGGGRVGHGGRDRATGAGGHRGDDEAVEVLCA
jgi:hypothetical protein